MSRKNTAVPNQASRNRSVNAKLAKLKEEVAPVITATRCRGDPPPAVAANYVWIDRRVRVTLNSQTSGTTTIAEIAGALGSTTGRIKILGIKIWNRELGKSIGVTTDSGLTINGATMKANDIGTGTSLAGINIRIPDTLAKTIALTSSSTTLIINEGSNITIDYHIRHSIDAA